MTGIVCLFGVVFFGCFQPQPRSLECFMRRHWRHFVAHWSFFHMTHRAACGILSYARGMLASSEKQ